MLAHKALLANLKISQWTGKKNDRQATNTVENSYSTRGNVGQYSKKLLPGASELENIQRLAGMIRVFFYRETLPWFSDGSRILSSKNYMDFTKAFREKKQEYDNAVADFVKEYPTLKADAKVKLGSLFVDSEYPDVGYLASTFSCEISFMPIPEVGDFRVQILDEEKQSFLARMKETENNALQDCWNRLHGVVSKAAEKLQNPESVFRDSLIENIQDICQLLPKLNVMDNPDLEAMRLQVEKLLCEVKPGDCRNSVAERKTAAAKLDDITSKMSVFMGG
jgi:hypothetical protein